MKAWMIGRHPALPVRAPSLCCAFAASEVVAASCCFGRPSAMATVESGEVERVIKPQPVGDLADTEVRGFAEEFVGLVHRELRFHGAETAPHFRFEATRQGGRAATDQCRSMR